MESPYHRIYTVDDDDNLICAISETEIQPLITEYESLKNALLTEDIARKKLVKSNLIRILIMF